jgi:pyrroloquinoline quinone biosynthesis protein B
LEAFAPLHPATASARNSPLEGILITNADLDHVAGLLLLREGAPLHIHAAQPVRDYLSSSLAFTRILDAFCGVVWHEPPVNQWATLLLSSGEPSGLSYEAISLPSPPPVFASSAESSEAQTVAYLIKDQRTEGVLLVAPDVFEITPRLTQALQTANAVLFDGTFWSENELGGVKAAARKASAMGHLPVKNGSLEILARSSARHRIYLHINNTNPMLAAASAERREVEGAGIVVGTDGIEFEV